MPQTDFSNTLEAATQYMNKNHEYDAACKKILEYKLVLSRILKATTEEFSKLSYEEIEKLIYDISSDENLDADMPKIHNADTESTSFTDGVRRFDVKFLVKDPKGNDRLGMVINIEAQNAFNSAEETHKRDEYYISRLISGQYKKTFDRSDFKRLKKVYSIWICTNPSEMYRDTVTEFPRIQRNIIGNLTTDKTVYDISSYVLVGLNSDLHSKHEFIRFLDTLFSPTVDFQTKKKILSEDYDISMENTGFGKDVEDMCDLSSGVMAIGEAKGEAKGEARGIILTLKGLDFSYDDVVAKLIEQLKISDEQAHEYMEMFWKD